jgi:hypothetical protein
VLTWAFSDLDHSMAGSQHARLKSFNTYRTIPKGTPSHTSRWLKVASSITHYVGQKRQNSKTSLDSVTRTKSSKEYQIC